MKQIKNIILFILKLITSLLHILYSYKNSKKLNQIFDKIYTFWISNNINRIGKTSLIGRDCTLMGGKYIEIGEETVIGKHAVLTCWDTYIKEKFATSIKIGDNCRIGEYCHISAINSIHIGNNVVTGRRITIVDNYHGRSTFEEMNIPPVERNLYSNGPVIIEDNVWLGDKASILPNVRIGKGAIIAANSLVGTDAPPFAVLAGVPARIVSFPKKPQL
jgi:acetyltransferase-like isoleucine patch superfamily enzyme